MVNSDSEAISKKVVELQSKLEAFSSSVCAHLEQFSSVCSNLSKSTSQQPTVTDDEFERKFNSIIFGVKENRDTSAWHSNANDILHFVTGRSVDIVDIFRLGWCVTNDSSNVTSHKPRPVLVKLRTVWDRRVILSNCSKLKQYTQRGCSFHQKPLKSDARRHSKDLSFVLNMQVKEFLLTMVF